MRFLAELYNCDVLNDKIINQCFGTLFKLILKGDDYYDAISMFTQSFIKKMKISNPNIYKKIKNEITGLLFEENEKKILFEGNEYNFKYPKLMHKFKIMEITDLFNNLEKSK